jgi:integration host factor subunit beta|tara:strand:+ start:209 stop:490 length:282 start_codon:yes stop_codon:yes gene_type:complete
LSRQNLIKKLKKKYPSLNNKEIEQIINIISETIEKGLKQGRKIELRGFGTFFTKKIKENYNAQNPNTKELIYVPEKNKVRFRPSRKLKIFINK